MSDDPFEKQMLMALQEVQSDLDAIVSRLDNRVNRPQPEPGPEPEPEPGPSRWDPPPRRQKPFTVPTEPVYDVVSSWKGDNVTADHKGILRDRAITGAYGSGRFDVAAFDSVSVMPDGAMFAVGVADHQPQPEPMPNEDYFNSDRGPEWCGWLYFKNSYFSKEIATEEWQGYGCKMHMHPQSDHSVWLEDVTFGQAREHNVYCEHVRHLYMNRVTCEDTGGNAVQVTSRGGRTDSGYYHGNPLQPASGLGGWAEISDLHVEARYHEFRDASEITFAGFCGPIVLDNCEVINAISAIAIWTDAYKGAWVANGKDVPWSRPVLYRDDKPIPSGLYSCPEVWIDNLTYTPDKDRPEKNRAAVMISGVQNVHINKFSIGGEKPAIDLDAEYGGPLTNGNVYFYDRQSVMDHIGRIGSSRSGRFVAYTAEELDKLIVS